MRSNWLRIDILYVKNRSQSRFSYKVHMKQTALLQLSAITERINGSGVTTTSRTPKLKCPPYSVINIILSHIYQVSYMGLYHWVPFGGLESWTEISSLVHRFPSQKIDQSKRPTQEESQDPTKENPTGRVTPITTEIVLEIIPLYLGFVRQDWDLGGLLNVRFREASSMVDRLDLKKEWALSVLGQCLFVWYVIRYIQ